MDYDYRFDNNTYPFPSSEVLPAVRKPQPIVFAPPPRLYAVNLSKARALLTVAIERANRNFTQRVIKALWDWRMFKAWLARALQRVTLKAEAVINNADLAAALAGKRGLLVEKVGPAFAQRAAMSNSPATVGSSSAGRGAYMR